MTRIEKHKHCSPVRMQSYSQIVNKLVRQGCYSISEMIEARGSMMRLMKRRKRLARS